MDEAKEAGCCGGSGGCKCMPMMIAIAIVCLLVGYFAAGMLQPKTTTPSGGTVQPVETGLSLDQVKAKVSTYMAQLVAAQPDSGLSVEVKNASKEMGMYNVLMDLKQDGQVVQQMTGLVSPDGTTMFLLNAAYGIYVPYDLTKEVPKSETPATPEVVKTDKPKVELYVMSFCPYGQQAENLIGPAAKLLGEKIALESHFVIYDKSYCEGMVSRGYFTSLDECKAEACMVDEASGAWYCSMHGINELNEDIRQMCILKNEPSMWWDYALEVNSKCTVSNIETCWKEAAKAKGVNESAVEKCFTDESLTLLAAETALNAAKGVSGSPTIFVNSASVPFSSGASAESFKATFCSAFNTAPTECGQALSTASTTASGSCG